MPFNFEDKKKEKDEKKMDAGKVAREAHEKNLEARKDKGFQFGDKDEEKEKK